eukprot:TRINITY_DN3269_c0_g6_i1.p2 TRINITY_DN3269_c0_g6~~TRINITY_DN3269_c0_g6_i1.p2  ORF type:complete len:171 (-),score=33.20 TRINITY_DN3269_c0_g6_i1:674-1126(-)
MCIRDRDNMTQNLNERREVLEKEKIELIGRKNSKEALVEKRIHLKNILTILVKAFEHSSSEKVAESFKARESVLRKSKEFEEFSAGPKSVRVDGLRMIKVDQAANQLKQKKSQTINAFIERTTTHPLGMESSTFPIIKVTCFFVLFLLLI